MIVYKISNFCSQGNLLKFLYFKAFKWQQSSQEAKYPFITHLWIFQIKYCFCLDTHFEAIHTNDETDLTEHLWKNVPSWFSHHSVLWDRDTQQRIQWSYNVFCRTSYPQQNKNDWQCKLLQMLYQKVDTQIAPLWINNDATR